LGLLGEQVRPKTEQAAPDGKAPVDPKTSRASAAQRWEFLVIELIEEAPRQ
jgi:hypothetical protein